MKLEKLFNILNRDIFDNMLELPVFIVNYDKTCYGYYGYADNHNIIAVLDSLDWYLKAGTIAHEMIHQWQSDNGYKLNHNHIFRKKAREIEIYYNLNKGDI